MRSFAQRHTWRGTKAVRYHKLERESVQRTLLFYIFIAYGSLFDEGNTKDMLFT